MTFSEIKLQTSAKLQTLSRQEEIPLWMVRSKATLSRMSLFDLQTDLPLENNVSSSLLIEALGDCFLEQLLETDLSSPTIWQHLTRLVNSDNLSSKATALTALVHFDYPESTMLANKTCLLAIQRKLKSAFTDSIQVSELVSY